MGALRADYMKERRTAGRLELPAKVAVTVLAHNGNGVDTCSGRTRDVSLGGLRLRTRKALPLHANVSLELRCERPVEFMQVQGRVGWVQRMGPTSFEIGVFVEGTPREDLVTWRRVLKRRGLLYT